MSEKLEKCPWWCPTCAEWLAWGEVTFEETHDERNGGCGEKVQTSEEAEMSRSVYPEWAIDLANVVKRRFCTSREHRPMAQCGECDDREMCHAFDAVPQEIQGAKESEPIGYEDCPECGSDETYYERFVPGKPKGVVACQDCGWTRDPIPAEAGE